MVNKIDSVTGTGSQTATIDFNAIKASGSGGGFAFANGQSAQATTSLQVDFALQTASHISLALVMDAGFSGPSDAYFSLSDSSNTALRSFRAGPGYLIPHVDQSLTFDLPQGAYSIAATQDDPSIGRTSTSYSFIFTAVAVPEPSSVILMFGGFSVLYAVPRRGAR